MGNWRKKFGILLPEFIELGEKRKNLPNLEEQEVAEGWFGKGFLKRADSKTFQPSVLRTLSIYLIFLAAFIILLARLIDLQIIQGKFFSEQAEGNHLRLQVIHAPRGVIFDRNGKVLAANLAGFKLVAEPASLTREEKENLLTNLVSLLGESRTSLEEKLKDTEKETVVLVENLPSDKALVIEAESRKLPKVKVEISPMREYPYRELISHVLGFTGEAEKDDLEKKLTPPYQLGDSVGKGGVEKAMEETLRGVNGYRLEKVTAQGEKKGEIYRSEPLPGKNVTLSIDIDLQKFVYEALEKKMRQVGSKGASAVVLDPVTGEILALVSLPSFDNNLFAKGLTAQDYQALISNPDKLLLNRSIGAAYPPGSTFKMVTAAAGLETGAIGPDTKIVDPGFVVLGSRTFENWLWADHKKTEGAINVVRAIARSTDTFFYILGQKIGIEAITKFAKTLGLGQTTGIELPGETTGFVPTPEWKKTTRNEPWYPGETLNVSIGQGDVLVTPLQISLVTAVFANGGKLLAPTILKRDKPKVAKEGVLKKETIETIREGLHQDTIGDGGVGWLFGSFKVPSAGKTGSAESGQERPHAWYTAYAPHPNAKIVVTVQVENAGHGSEVAAPVVKEIFDWWFIHRN